MEIVKYRRIAIQSPAPEPPAEELRAVEDALGVPIPDDFQEFLRHAHNGHLAYLVKVPSREEVFSFPDIYLVGRDGNGEYGPGTVLGELEKERQWRRLPSEVLPFARGGESVALFLDLTPLGKGRVVTLSSDLSEPDREWQENRLIVIAESFADYLDRLFLDEEEEVSSYRDAVEAGDERAATLNAQYLDVAIPGWRERFNLS